MTDYTQKDEELYAEVYRMMQGDFSNYERMYELSVKYIYKIIYDIIKDLYVIEDLVQETYLTIYNKIPSLQDARNFYSWAGRIATNNALMYIRKNKAELLAFVDENGEESDFIFQRAREDNEAFIPENIYMNQEKQRLLANILDQLPVEQKLCIQYFYYEEMSVQEIADTMECSTGTIKSRLNYARKTIKQAVLDMNENSNEPLYSLASVPLFLLVFRQSVEHFVVQGAVSAGGVAALGAVGKAAVGKSAIGNAVVGKVGAASAVSAGSVGASGTVATVTVGAAGSTTAASVGAAGTATSATVGAGAATTATIGAGAKAAIVAGALLVTGAGAAIVHHLTKEPEPAEPVVEELYTGDSIELDGVRVNILDILDQREMEEVENGENLDRKHVIAYTDSSIPIGSDDGNWIMYREQGERTWDETFTNMSEEDVKGILAMNDIYISYDDVFEQYAGEAFKYFQAGECFSEEDNGWTSYSEQFDVKEDERIIDFTVDQVDYRMIVGKAYIYINYGDYVDSDADPETGTHYNYRYVGPKGDYKKEYAQSASYSITLRGEISVVEK